MALVRLYMNRKIFIQNSMAGLFFNVNSFLQGMAALKWSDRKMPALFIGHGNPMNAIEQNEFHNSWKELGKKLPRPKAILCVSAHWLTHGTRITAMPKPKTIHDFYGFPPELFAVQYPAAGSPEMVGETKKAIQSVTVTDDLEWGIDHGTWSVLLPMYPQADIPVFQLSIDYKEPAQFHYNLGKELGKLREKGVLIIGSGNIVHNLRLVSFGAQPFAWAAEFDQKIKELIDKGDHQSVIEYDKLGHAAKLSIPTNDHYLPLMYPLALKTEAESLTWFNEKTDAGSISMRSMIIA
jgi:4,5-DOPA dioxygenase extradiol